MQLDIYERLIRPILFRMDAEDAHNLIHKLAPALATLPVRFNFSARNLETSIASTKLANPIGLAAGFDKNGKLIGVLDKLGFGFVEVGSVSAEPTAGNSRPRLFRLPLDQAIINRMGLNGDGVHVVADRIREGQCSIPIGLNIVKTNKPNLHGQQVVQDVVRTFDQVRELPLAYIAFNASCPNTHQGILQEKDELERILSAVQSRNQLSVPIFVKLSPDSSEELLVDLVEVARVHKIAGYILGNTTVSRDGLKTPAAELAAIGPGGLSGMPLKDKAMDLCRKVATIKQADQQIIACGGIASGQDAFDFLKCGASALQLYTGLIYHGPGLVSKINRELSALLAAEGTKNILANAREFRSV